MSEFSSSDSKEEKIQIPRFTGGPHGVGDPDDKSLRHVERDNAIPKLLQAKTKKEKCYAPIRYFQECVSKHQQWFGAKFMFSCREERDVMNDCLVTWYYDPEFVNEVTKIYLDRRSYYRQTGQQHNINQ